MPPLIEIDPDVVQAWVLFLTPVFAVLAAVWRWEKRVSRRLDEAEETRQELTVLLEKQFGPNSGGLREALNATRADVAEIKASQEHQVERMDEHIKFHLEGR
jgi:hypothetical protein